MGTGNPDFDLFQLPEEHVALREAIRALAEKDIEPTPPTSTRTHASRVRRSPPSSPTASTPSTFPRNTTVRAPTRSPPASSSKKSPRVRVVVADPGRQQARHDGPDPQRLRRPQAAGPAVHRRG